MIETIPEAGQLPIYATVESLEKVWREMDGDDELATAHARIQAAHTVVRAELATAGMPTLEALVAAGRLTVDVVAFVIHDMVRVSMQDAGSTSSVPSGATAATFTTGPFSRQFSFDGATREGSVRLSKQNRRMLGLGQPYLYSIDLL